MSPLERLRKVFPAHVWSQAGSKYIGQMADALMSAEEAWGKGWAVTWEVELAGTRVEQGVLADRLEDVREQLINWYGEQWRKRCLVPSGGWEQ